MKKLTTFVQKKASQIRKQKRWEESVKCTPYKLKARYCRKLIRDTEAPKEAAITKRTLYCPSYQKQQGARDKLRLLFTMLLEVTELYISKWTLTLFTMLYILYILIFSREKTDRLSTWMVAKVYRTQQHYRYVFSTQVFIKVSAEVWGLVLIRVGWDSAQLLLIFSKP